MSTRRSGRGRAARHRDSCIHVSEQAVVRRLRALHRLKEALQAVLREAPEDPLVVGLVLLEVTPSPDGSSAKVALLAPKGRSLPLVEAALGRAAGFLRARLAERLEGEAPALRLFCVGHVEEGGAA